MALFEHIFPTVRQLGEWLSLKIATQKTADDEGSKQEGSNKRAAASRLL
jgi:hypothetical protein